MKSSNETLRHEQDSPALPTQVAPPNATVNGSKAAPAADGPEATAPNLRALAQACRGFLNQLEELEAALSDAELRCRAETLKIHCLTELLAIGPVVDRYRDLLERLQFVEYFNPIPGVRSTRPASYSIAAAIAILERASEHVKAKAPMCVSKVEIAPRFPASDWPEVTITFFNEHSVKITVAGNEQNCDYAELGLADRRGAKGKPVSAWTILQALAESGGVIKAHRGTANWSKVEKQVETLRKWLRQTFVIEADPLPFEKGLGYRAKFKIQRSPSYRQ